MRRRLRLLALGAILATAAAALVAIGLELWMLRDVLLPDAPWRLEAPHAPSMGG